MTLREKITGLIEAELTRAGAIYEGRPAETAKAIIAACRPEGHVLVREEPTEAMLAASQGWREHDCPEDWDIAGDPPVRVVYGVYRAMIAAAKREG